MLQPLVRLHRTALELEPQFLQREAVGLRAPGEAEEERGPWSRGTSEPAGYPPRPQVTSHLRPPRPRDRHNPARHTQPGSQQHGRRHLPLGCGNLSLGQRSGSEADPTWGCQEPAKGVHWLRQPWRECLAIPLGRALGSPLAPPPESFHPIGCFCQLDDFSNPLASSRRKSSFIFGSSN